MDYAELLVCDDAPPNKLFIFIASAESGCRICCRRAFGLLRGFVQYADLILELRDDGVLFAAELFGMLLERSRALFHARSYLSQVARIGDGAQTPHLVLQATFAVGAVALDRQQDLIQRLIRTRQLLAHAVDISRRPVAIIAQLASHRG